MDQIAEFHHTITSLTVDSHTGSIVVALNSGQITAVDESSPGKSNGDVIVETGGHPSGIVLDPTGRMFIADIGHKAILTFSDGECVSKLVEEYEGVQFNGPNSLCLHSNGTIFFTDSGPLGTTTLEKPTGSVFAITGSDRLLVPILKHCLAHPSGICLSNDHSMIYVAETLRNQILRISRSNHSAQIFHSSVFYRFQGGLGPMGLSVSSAGNLFVAQSEIGTGGRLMVISPRGQLIASLDIDQIRTVMAMGPKDPFVYMTQSNIVVKVPLDQLEQSY